VLEENNQVQICHIYPAESNHVCSFTIGDLDRIENSLSKLNKSSTLSFSNVSILELNTEDVRKSESQPSLDKKYLG
jgi:hypothetical protein